MEEMISRLSGVQNHRGTKLKSCLPWEENHLHSLHKWWNIKMKSFTFFKMYRMWTSQPCFTFVLSDITRATSPTWSPFRSGTLRTGTVLCRPTGCGCCHMTLPAYFTQWVPVSARKLCFPLLLFHAPVVFIEGSLYCFCTYPKQKCASLTEACLKGQDSCVVPLSNMPTRAIWQGHFDLAATFNFWSWHLPTAFSC